MKRSFTGTILVQIATECAGLRDGQRARCRSGFWVAGDAVGGGARGRVPCRRQVLSADPTRPPRHWGCRSGRLCAPSLSQRGYAAPAREPSESLNSPSGFRVCSHSPTPSMIKNLGDPIGQHERHPESLAPPSVASLALGQCDVSWQALMPSSPGADGTALASRDTRLLSGMLAGAQRRRQAGRRRAPAPWPSRREREPCRSAPRRFPEPGGPRRRHVA